MFSYVEHFHFHTNHLCHDWIALNVLQITTDIGRTTTPKQFTFTERKIIVIKQYSRSSEDDFSIYGIKTEGISKVGSVRVITVNQTSTSTCKNVFTSCMQIIAAGQTYYYGLHEECKTIQHRQYTERNWICMYAQCSTGSSQEGRGTVNRMTKRRIEK